MTTKTLTKKTASQRQREFVSRKVAAGYVALSSLFVPRAIADECRQLVKDHVAEWEAANQL